MPRLSPAILQRARELRQPQTPSEQRLWCYLRARQLDGLKFRRQHPVGYYILDFYCPERQLAVEIDGDSHAEQVEYDLERTRWLESLGIQVIRFANRDVVNHLEGVLEEIRRVCQEAQVKLT